ncbi:Sec-independent protein translocase subunit TatA [Arthrobacter sp. Br18]|uniref:Sec-independent protein translocase subunit TatA n=1 Tax=Arthrobacter sp. Br18 TaxID=1312954 RepID=UPI0004B65138|nr:Sec-independent protein translocase subunit TatA [Arthrobacter sp. Br18]
MRLEGWHLIIIIAVAVLLFGAPKLPGLARSVGQSLRIFKSEVKQMKEDGHDTAEEKSVPVVGNVVVPSRPDGTARAADASAAPDAAGPDAARPGPGPQASVHPSARSL